MCDSDLTSLTRPHPVVWQITMSAGPDNRATREVLDQISQHLDTVEAEWRRGGCGAGALIVTSSLPKFFCNGLGMPEKNMEVFVYSECPLGPSTDRGNGLG